MGSISFVYTGAVESWVVPAGVTRIQVDIVGGNATQGFTLPAWELLIPGETLYVAVGGAPDGSGAGGWNGGGVGVPYTGLMEFSDGSFSPSGTFSSAGWGAADVRRGGSGVADRVIVAGGRGGMNLTQDVPTGDIVTATAEGNFAGARDDGMVRLLSTMPGPTDDPRVALVPDLSSFPDFQVTAPGQPGGTDTGGDANSVANAGPPADPLYNSTSGAGGGGWGAGASGALCGSISEPLRDGLIFDDALSRTGASYVNDDVEVVLGPILADPFPLNPFAPGVVFIQASVTFSWVDPDTSKWSVGHLNWSS